MSKRKAIKPPAVPPVPTIPPPPPPPPPPEGEYHTFTTLAALCQVTEQTVRRWVWYETIPQPRRFGRLQFWPKAQGEEIARRYLADGGFGGTASQTIVESKP